MTSQNIATPAVQLIDGIPFVRVIDLGHLWNTTTASILATDKPHQVPEEHIRRIDGRVWCSFPGLRYRVTAAKRGGHLTSLIREFLESHIEKKPTPEPTPTPTTLGTAALIADARRTASQALAKAQEAEEQAGEARGVAYDAKVDAEDNAKSLDAFDDRVAAMENDSYRRFDTVMTRCHRVETRQGDAAVNMTRLENRQHWTAWTLAATATIQALAAIIRLARR